MDRSIQYSGREVPLLRKADAARKSRAVWRGAAIASGLLAPLVALFFAVLMLVFGVGLGMVMTALVALTPVLGFLAYATTRAGARGAEIAPAIDAAWMAAASDVAAQARGPVSASDLGKKLGLEEPQAEELMALLDVNAAIAPRARILVDNPGAEPASRLVDNPGAEPASRLVDKAAPPSAVSPTQIASAEDEAAAIEASAAEEAARRKGSA